MNNQEIQLKMNEYLFETCFNPVISTKNYEYFADYLLMNLSSVYGSQYEREWQPNEQEFTKVLKKEKLIEYWRKNGDRIKRLDLCSRDKTIYTGNYQATYKNDLQDIYVVLDKMISN